MFGKLDEPEMIENYAQPVGESITIGKYALYKVVDDNIHIAFNDGKLWRPFKESDLEAVIEKFYNDNI